MQKLRHWTLACIIGLALGLPAPAAAAGSITIIANPSAPVDALSQASLRAIFAMRIRQWPDGSPVTVFVLPDADRHHASFCKEVLRVYPYVLRDTWDRMVYTGAGQAPTQLTNAEDVMRLVSQTPGSIGYIEKGNSNELVKTLEIR